jgi:YHS domain-containing protein
MHVAPVVPADGIAIDPVCHMEVDIATAKFTSIHNDITYYFCAPGCKRSFDKNPEAYVSVQHEASSS